MPEAKFDLPVNDVCERSITPEMFAKYWETTILPDGFEKFLKSIDTYHREADKYELEKYLEMFIDKVSKSSAIRNEEENLAIFEKGWAGNKKRVQENGLNFESLSPVYYKKDAPSFFHENGTLYICGNSALTAEMQLLYVRYLALTFFKDCRSIHEFGSGTGINLLSMALLFPQKEIIGYEWTQSGIDLANLIGEKTGSNVRGRYFDMLRPDYSVNLTGAAVLTFGSVEQLSEHYGDFLEFLIRGRPALVAHVEPDTSTPPPGLHKKISVYYKLSLLYMRLRGYPKYFTQNINTLYSQGKIDILFSRQLPFPIYSSVRCIIWKPV
jgi:hypothetical protein